jgi:hypothetical protein
MTLGQIKKQQEEKLSQLFKDNGVFFAFSDEQFAENKTPLEPGDTYSSFYAGGYLPKKNFKQAEKGLNDIMNWKEQAIQDNGLREQHICYELSNHEAFYTYEIEDTLDALGGDYTREEVWEVFNKNKDKYDE